MLNSESTAISRIINSEVVHRHFGYWPNFHDAEIKRVIFESNPGYHPSVTVLLSAFERTQKTDEIGGYKILNNCDIQFQFNGIRAMEFDNFSHQNAILYLAFEEAEDTIKCTIDAATGLEAVIVAEEIIVTSLTPTQ
ncbi:Imm50 family immunity protein [Hymenobacter psychrotolerans]|uniref:Imm50 family immunity protein n=1 Tax=Hymenobacter psychrotolerans TaxID=344998 RepID=UPI000933D71B|nr:Imm50 family immunity protein [Hymenobacter psychrotolerans]